MIELYLIIGLGLIIVAGVEGQNFIDNFDKEKMEKFLEE